MEKIDAIIRVEFGIDPDSLGVDEWSKMYGQWMFVQEIRARNSEAILKKVLVEFMGEFSKKLGKQI